MPLTPNNREEHWLQGMVDGETTLEPNKRREYWYKEIVDAIGSGGGGGGGALIVTVSYDEQTGTSTINKTVQELIDAYDAGMVILFHELVREIKTRYYLSSIETPFEEGDKYHITIFTTDNFASPFGMEFVADNASDYPVTEP